MYFRSGSRIRHANTAITPVHVRRTSDLQLIISEVQNVAWEVSASLAKSFRKGAQNSGSRWIVFGWAGNAIETDDFRTICEYWHSTEPRRQKLRTRERFHMIPTATLRSRYLTEVFYTSHVFHLGLNQIEEALKVDQPSMPSISSMNCLAGARAWLIDAQRVQVPTSSDVRRR
jgi:hypothetical protein